MSFNASSPTVKRLLSEYRALAAQPEPDFVAGPVNDDLFVWHFTIKGPRDTPFEGGIYHGKIMFPQQYPLKPPDIYFLTPNGRFETRKKICLTMTSFHPDMWNPAWDVRTALTSIIAFMPTRAEGAVGAIDMSDMERRALAVQSHAWKCSECEFTIDPDPIKGTEEAGEPAQAPVEHKEEEEAHVEDEDAIEEVKDTEAVEEHKEGEEEEGTHNEEEDVKEGPVVDEDGIQHFNYEEMVAVKVGGKKKGNFVPLLDIPILILFLLLMGLIGNSTFHWVDFFPAPK